ncbi:RNA polymerase factor sigma-54 [uncultured Selenomonas sp.]|uniref:RNA polymerase factor sigma-54 n=1 Tax=uncultured Selenomonas sp. TaxID=159275 RepID=UPI0025FFF8D5|nr:RNA polymerase factor sigma-54 [uncultured Selenomonas sp.]
MEQSQALSQNLSQHLAMTMKMQQAIKILALPAQELRGLIEKEYLENPALEIDYDHAALSFEETTGTAGDDAREEREQAYRAEDISALASYLGSPERGDGWDGGESGEPHAFEQAKPVSRTLEEELLEQVEFAYPAGREQEKAVAVFLVGSIDSRGYLAVPLAEAARATGVKEDIATQVLATIQSFEPAGVGARTLAECLRLQAKRRGIYEGLVARIIDAHLEDVANSRIKEIASAEGVRPSDVQMAVDIVRTLTPKPGAAYGSDDPGYITPDVVVRPYGAGWRIELTSGGVPGLHISRLYQEAAGYDEETQSYIRGRLSAAAWLIKNIETRRETIRRVAEEIVRRQRPVLTDGLSRLAPMTMQDVAEAADVHESTVSRAVQGKYIEMPSGIYPMKAFFTANLAAGAGEAAYGARQVQDALAALVAAEDPKKPLSDAKLAKLLADKGLEISRRTVVKYREQLGIPSSVKRKRY